jgi:hypothetical protein
VKPCRYAPLEHPLVEELAWSTQVPDLAHLIRREDIPRAPQRLPRALTPHQDQLIQQELLRRNDLPSNVLLLMRHTGMRIGECVDLAYDCLHSAGPDQWAIHVPLGKLKTERMVPIDSFVCRIVHRLRFFRSFDPLPFDARLLGQVLQWAPFAGVSLALAVLATVHFRQPPSETHAIRFQVPLPDKVTFGRIDWPMVSPNGQRIVYPGIAADRTRHLWVRSPETRVLVRRRSDLWSCRTVCVST